MATISLFWDTNIAIVTSCENTPLAVLSSQAIVQAIVVYCGVCIRHLFPYGGLKGAVMYMYKPWN